MAWRITVVCGGLGGARLALALRDAGLAHEACFVTNVADDLVWDGTLVCPDTDAVLYALAGVFDHDRGWGIAGDEMPSSPGAWFRVGRRDREHHLRRQELLASMPLSAATAVLAAELGVESGVVPATDAPVRTMVRRAGAWLTFQEWLVREGAPEVESVACRGIDTATPAPRVLEAIDESDLVVIASSSPVASIEPTLALPGVCDALRGRRSPTVGVSPVAQHRPLGCERDRTRAAARARLLAAAGSAHTPAAVAARYADLLDVFVLDPADARDAQAISDLGLRVELVPVTGLTGEERAALVGLLARLAGVPTA